MKEQLASLRRLGVQCLADLRVVAESNTEADIITAQRCKHLLQECLQHKLLDKDAAEECSLLFEKADAKLKAWAADLTLGSRLEIFNVVEQKWFNAVIVQDAQPLPDGVVRLHYTGWPDKYDNVLVLREQRVQPPGTFVFYSQKPKPSSTNSTQSSTEPPKQREPSKDAVEAASISGASGTNSAGAAEENDQESGARRPRRRAAVIASSAVSASIGNGASNEELDQKAKRSKLSKDDLNIINSDWHCMLCGMLETIQDSGLLVCTGECKRAVHVVCLRGDPNAADDWTCDDCKTGRHECFACGKMGTDFVDVFKCNSSKCGKYYHMACLQNPPHTFLAPPLPPKTQRETELQGSALALYWQHTVKDRRPCPEKLKITSHSFKCPRHICDTCFSYYGSSERSHGMTILDGCLFCPRAFHTNCIPPGSRFNTVCLICPLHPEKALPGNPVDFIERHPLHSTTPSTATGTTKETTARSAKNASAQSSSSSTTLTSSSSSATLSTDEGAEAKARSSAENHLSEKNGCLSSPSTNYYSRFWEQVCIPEIFPHPKSWTQDLHFLLDVRLKHDLDHTPQNYQTITKNDYDTFPAAKLPPLHIPAEGCECVGACLPDRCLNHAMRVECWDSMTSSKESKICACGSSADCRNRALQRKEYVSTTIFSEGEMGWGLRAAQPVRRGQLVMEYVGEIIDEEETSRRLVHQTTCTPQDKDFYIMELDNGMYVDGKRKGNASRFINHSCDPNCELQRWNVRGRLRIAIVAIRDIAESEPLSYDYQFDTQEENTFRCYCKTAKCRGTMAPRKRDRMVLQAIKSNDKELRGKWIKEGQDRLKRANADDVLRESEMLRSYTGRFLPGDSVCEIKHGPPKNLLAVGRTTGCLLVRNVVRSTWMLRRKELREKQREAREKERKSQAAATKHGSKK